MKVNIIKLCQCVSEGGVIEFSSQYGSAKGLWKGDIPEINQHYYIELDIPKILIWGIDIVEADCKEYKVWNEQNNIFLNVQLEYYDDNCTTVRIGDSLILIETQGIPYSVDTFLKIQLNEMLIYPFEL